MREVGNRTSAVSRAVIRLTRSPFCRVRAHGRDPMSEASTDARSQSGSTLSTPRSAGARRTRSRDRMRAASAPHILRAWFPSPSWASKRSEEYRHYDITEGAHVASAGVTRIVRDPPTRPSKALWAVSHAQSETGEQDHLA